MANIWEIFITCKYVNWNFSWLLQNLCLKSEARRPFISSLSQDESIVILATSPIEAKLSLSMLLGTRYRSSCFRYVSQGRQMTSFTTKPKLFTSILRHLGLFGLRYLGVNEGFSGSLKLHVLDL